MKKCKLTDRASKKKRSKYIAELRMNYVYYTAKAAFHHCCKMPEIAI